MSEGDTKEIQEIKKPKLLFVYNTPYENMWRDGLWAAVELLKNDFEVEKVNLRVTEPHEIETDFVLGWGAFFSPVDKILQSLPTDVPKGLCIGGTSTPPWGAEKYNVLFYETPYYEAAIKEHPNKIHAFGINSNIYKPVRGSKKIWDILTVGSFSLWKRQLMLADKPGLKLAVGEIQKENYQESLDIIANLLMKGVAISDMIPPETLANIYRASKSCYLPMSVNGGGERAVLEARACGIPVYVEQDNPKLTSLLTCPIWDHFYYYEQLLKGIKSCL